MRSCRSREWEGVAGRMSSDPLSSSLAPDHPIMYIASLNNTRNEHFGADYAQDLPTLRRGTLLRGACYGAGRGNLASLSGYLTRWQIGRASCREREEIER